MEVEIVELTQMALDRSGYMNSELRGFNADLSVSTSATSSSSYRRPPSRTTHSISPPDPRAQSHFDDYAPHTTTLSTGTPSPCNSPSPSPPTPRLQELNKLHLRLEPRPAGASQEPHRQQRQSPYGQLPRRGDILRSVPFLLSL